MNILVLGGTQMVGRDFVSKLLETQTHNVTLANRCVTNASIFPETKRIKIDRNFKELCSSLSSDTAYDYVFDFSCYNIRQFLNTAGFIKCNYYVYISTLGVFDVSADQTYSNDNTPHARYLNYCIDKRNIETYIQQTEFDYKIFIIRPCVIYGENDYTDRFEQRDGQYYWKNTNIKADHETNCVHISIVTQNLIDILEKDQTYRQKKNIVNIGKVNNVTLPS